MSLKATNTQGAPFVHTPRPGRERKKGVVRRYVGVRMPEHLAEYVEAKARLGVKLTDVVLDLVQFGKDIEDELGIDLYEVERQAKVDGIMPGTALGRMVKAALEKGRKR